MKVKHKTARKITEKTKPLNLDSIDLKPSPLLPVSCSMTSSCIISLSLTNYNTTWTKKRVYLQRHPRLFSILSGRMCLKVPSCIRLLPSCVLLLWLSIFTHSPKFLFRRVHWGWSSYSEIRLMFPNSKDEKQVSSQQQRLRAPDFLLSLLFLVSKPPVMS